MRDRWHHWHIVSKERLCLDDYDAVVFGRVQGTMYDSVVYLRYELTRKQAKECFKECELIEPAGRVLSLAQALRVFGKDGPYSDAFDYVDHFRY